MKKKKRSSLQKSYYGYLFIAPFFLVFLVFGLFPLINTFELAFYKYDMNIRSDTFVGFTYFKRVLKDEIFWRAVRNTLILWGGSYFFEISTAMFIAAIFTYTTVKWGHFFKSAFFVPNIVSTTAVATLFSLFCGYPSGVFNQCLQALGIVDEPVKFLSNPITLRMVIIFIGWWMWYGRTSIIAHTGMTSIGNEIYESAKIDGARFIDIFWKITIPLIRPTLTFMFVTSAIGGLQTFDIPYMLVSNGGPKNAGSTAVTYIYQQAYGAGNFGYAAAATSFLFLIIVIASFSINTVINRKER